MVSQRRLAQLARQLAPSSTAPHSTPAAAASLPPAAAAYMRELLADGRLVGGAIGVAKGGKLGSTVLDTRVLGTPAAATFDGSQEKWKEYVLPPARAWERWSMGI